MSVLLQNVQKRKKNMKKIPSYRKHMKHILQDSLYRKKSSNRTKDLPSFISDVISGVKKYLLQEDSM